MTAVAPLAFVIPTHRPVLGEHAANELAAMNLNSNDLVVLVAQNSEDYSFSNIDSRVHLIRSQTTGATFARNEGIDYVLNTLGTHYLFVFPNDQSRYSSDCITALRGFSASHPNSIALGVWHISDFNVDLCESSWSNLSQLDYRDAFTAYEPAIAIPGNVFNNLRFDNRIGTGSSTFAQSGEAPDLMMQALSNGFKVYRLMAFVASNPSTTYRLSWHQGLRKIYRYACGSGYGYRRWSTQVGILRSYLQIFSPIASYLTGKVYWRTMGLLNAIVATFGRIHGRFFIRIR